jgi:hypothetical protein
MNNKQRHHMKGNTHSVLQIDDDMHARVASMPLRAVARLYTLLCCTRRSHRSGISLSLSLSTDSVNTHVPLHSITSPPPPSVQYRSSCSLCIYPLYLHATYHIMTLVYLPAGNSSYASKMPPATAAALERTTEKPQAQAAQLPLLLQLTAAQVQCLGSAA